LLREELIGPLQESLKLIFEDLRAPNIATTHIGRLMREKGGVYRRENTYIEVFTNAIFESFSLNRAGFAVGLSLDKPPSSRGMSSKEFWEGKKGLSRGILVGLVFRGRVYLGVVESGELVLLHFSVGLSILMLVTVIVLLIATQMSVPAANEAPSTSFSLDRVLP
jgi:hypothetical protein